jgi:hypothetical protein
VCVCVCVCLCGVRREVQREGEWKERSSEEARESERELACAKEPL